MFAPRIDCRACGADGLIPYLDLGMQAPANALRKVFDDTPEFTAPLSLAWCPACGLSQLEQVVDPKLLYTDYPFRAGASQVWREHCQELVEDADQGALWLDIGSNDGVLLESAHAAGFEVLGVDPSDTGNKKIPMLERFWSVEAAKEVTRRFGQADVISATNVFGHVDDARGFLEGVAIAIKPDGQAIIECPHIFPFLENVAFDTVYHEHLTIWSLRPLELLAEPLGLRVVDVRMFPDLHGGTARYILRPGDADTKVSRNVKAIQMYESAHFQKGIAPYQVFAEQASDRIQSFRDQLTQAGRAGQRIWGYGASAKGAVYLQAAGLSEVTMERIVDDTEAKWGLLSPGSRIPITEATDLSTPDILVLLSWNNGPELQAKARARGFTGRFFIPHPVPYFA